MGEAKRRHATGETPQADRLPDFIFGRDKAAEKAGGFVLAGKLITDIPAGTEPSKDEALLITEIVKRLALEVRRDPHLIEAGVWRDGVRPPDGVSPPFPEAAVVAKAQRFAVVAVRVDPRNDGMMRLDDAMLAEIMGRH